jgi:hypothetical protein
MTVIERSLNRLPRRLIITSSLPKSHPNVGGKTLRAAPAFTAKFSLLFTYSRRRDFASIPTTQLSPHRNEVSFGTAARRGFNASLPL